MRRTQKGTGTLLLSLVAAGALVAGCTTSGGGSTSSTAAPTGGSGAESSSSGGAAPADGTITYAAEQDFYAYNTFTVDGNATANQTVLNQVLRGFSYVDNKGAVQMDTDFGTIEKTSDSPLTVKYTFNDKAVWSDGQPIGCADFLMLWAAASGYYNADGSTNPQGPTADSTNLFQAASTTGVEDTEKPTCKDGDKTVTSGNSGMRPSVPTPTRVRRPSGAPVRPVDGGRGGTLLARTGATHTHRTVPVARLAASSTAVTTTPQSTAARKERRGSMDTAYLSTN